jgi:hypothetical protein
MPNTLIKQIGAHESKEDGNLSLNTWGFVKAIYLVISPNYQSKAMG